MSVRDPPPYSVCGYCTANEAHKVVFKGPGSWEKRMDHIGQHLESGHGYTKTWVEDVGLRDWLIEEKLIEQVEDGSYQPVGLKGHSIKAIKKMLLEENAVSEELFP